VAVTTKGVPPPTRRQYRITRAVVAWYVDAYYQTDDDVGVPAMFCREDRVGEFAVDAEALAAGDGDALFRLLVSMTMFQRRSDLQIMRVLRGISRADAEEMTDATTLLHLADAGGCPNARDVERLKDRCDLGKDPVSKAGVCTFRPKAPCHMKRHTELLKRYGHFGKVPTSAALALRANGVASLAELRELVWQRIDCPSERAQALERAVSRSWRVSEKIAAMFLSAVTNRDLSGALAPWADGIASDHFVVIDSNVDLFLRATGYVGPMTYAGRRQFVQALSRRVPLDEYRPGLQPFNPRLVQQALYMFMSESNRRASETDCSQEPSACETCPSDLANVCPRRSEPTRHRRTGA